MRVSIALALLVALTGLAAADRTQQERQLKVVFWKFDPALKKRDFASCLKVLEQAIAGHTDEQVVHTFGVWKRKVTRAGKIWDYLVSELKTRKDITLATGDRPSTVTGVAGTRLTLTQSLDLSALSAMQLRALLSQTGRYRGKDDMLEEAVADLWEVCAPDTTLFVRLASKVDVKRNPYVEVDDGSWGTFLGNPQHNAFVAGYWRGKAERRWRVDAAYGARIAATPTSIYAVSGQRHGTVTLHRLSMATGRVMKSVALGKTATLNPPAVYKTYVFYQKANHSQTRLLCLDAASLKTLWSSRCPEQWSSHEHPTPYRDNVFVNGGYYGGWFGFSLEDGRQLWFGKLPGYDGWTPCLYKDTAYAAVGGKVVALEAQTGKQLWQVEIKSKWGGWSAKGAVVAAQDKLFITSGNLGLQCFDLKQRKVRWRAEGKLPPVIGPDAVISPAGSRLHAYFISTGRQRWEVDLHERVLGTPVLKGSLLIVSTARRTYFLQAKDGGKVGAVEESGDLVVVGDRLLIHGKTGITCYQLR